MLAQPAKVVPAVVASRLDIEAHWRSSVSGVGAHMTEPDVFLGRIELAMSIGNSGRVRQGVVRRHGFWVKRMVVVLHKELVYAAETRCHLED